jgi:NAD(P)-dependent dehydrogenase (short-subunit alcohol dehydrogenase family)
MKDKVVVVTGGTSGIGRAAAIAMAAAGARVVAGGRREEGAALVAEIEAAGGQARFVRTDVANEAAILRALSALRRRVMGDATSPSTMPGSS